MKKHKSNNSSKHHNEGVQHQEDSHAVVVLGLGSDVTPGEPEPFEGLLNTNYQLSSFEEVHDGSDIVINCNFVMESIENETVVEKEEELMNDIDTEGERGGHEFIAEIVSDLVNCAGGSMVGIFNSSCYNDSAPDIGRDASTVVQVEQSSVNTSYQSTLCNTGCNYPSVPYAGANHLVQQFYTPAPASLYSAPIVFDSEMTGSLDSRYFVPFQMPVAGPSRSSASTSSNSVSVASFDTSYGSLNVVAEASVNSDVSVLTQASILKSQGRSSSKGYTCPHCGVGGIVGPSKLQTHIDRMHSSPVICKICDVTFVDKYCFVLHYPKCFFFCTKPGCNFHDKRRERFNGHMRTHENM